MGRNYNYEGNRENEECVEVSSSEQCTSDSLGSEELSHTDKRAQHDAVEQSLRDKLHLQKMYNTMILVSSKCV